MPQPNFTIADLEPEELEEVRNMEQKLSESAGHTISLIAYEAGQENPASKG
ncbi:hypothetical protein B0G52_11524 [Cohnella sp. SGD-V74]|jgi:hypothetical protein|uniref:hypothetical protein n=1 Tax=unclassified Cohnella TaxID=2636738 RepID=UPI000D4375C4|nr:MULTISPECIES: hypothetical protein [unclassified Cohnella]PRX67015.1 hypothetical protein B0G52_11524 [Cohnella sp. SGD-V74]